MYEDRRCWEIGVNADHAFRNIGNAPQRTLMQKSTDDPSL